jgi:integrase
MAPDKAREQARKVFAKVADGGDPMADRKPTKTGLATVENMFKAYVANMREKGKVSAVEVERALLLSQNSAATALGRDRPANEVQPHEVVAYAAKFFRKGFRASADKARSYIASAYAWAMSSANDYTSSQRFDWQVTINPAANIAKDSNATKCRDRNLEIEEIRALWEATESGNGGFSLEVAACIKMMISCGQRVQETLRIDGSEIDLVNGLWNMPKEKTKGRKHPHTIPLPRQAISVLAELKDRHGDGPLFKGYRGEGTIRYASVNNAIAVWLKGQPHLEKFQTRDLRRTWKSRSHDAGIDRFTRDLIQQHAKSDTGSKHYDRANYLPQMTEAMNKWADWLDACMPAPLQIESKAAVSLLTYLPEPAQQAA